MKNFFSFGRIFPQNLQTSRFRTWQQCSSTKNYEKYVSKEIFAFLKRKLHFLAVNSVETC
jgi:hypothetical protein